MLHSKIPFRFKDPAEWGNRLTDSDFYVLSPQCHSFPELVPFPRLTKSFPVFKHFLLLHGTEIPINQMEEDRFS